MSFRIFFLLLFLSLNKKHIQQHDLQGLFYFWIFDDLSTNNTADFKQSLQSFGTEIKSTLCSNFLFWKSTAFWCRTGGDGRSLPWPDGTVHTYWSVCRDKNNTQGAPAIVHDYWVETLKSVHLPQKTPSHRPIPFRGLPSTMYVPRPEMKL